jgi:predicted tellurium resistance membrane protein TerC
LNREKGVVGEMNTEETKKKNFRHIVKGCALVLCLLFFVCPLVKCSQDSSLTASGWEIATGTGKLFSEDKDDGNPLVFALVIIPAVLLALAFTNKSFIVLRNVSIAGLVAKIIFLIAVNMKLNSDDYKGAFELTGNNWLIVFIYVGLIGFMQYCIKQEETTKESENIQDVQ